MMSVTKVTKMSPCNCENSTSVIDLLVRILKFKLLEDFQLSCSAPGSLGLKMAQVAGSFLDAGDSAAMPPAAYIPWAIDEMLLQLMLL